MSTKEQSTIDKVISETKVYIRDIADGMLHWANNLTNLTEAGEKEAHALTCRALRKLIDRCEHIIALTNNIQLHEDIELLKRATQNGLPDIRTKRFQTILALLLKIDRSCNAISVSRQEIAEVKAKTDELMQWFKWLKQTKSKKPVRNKLARIIRDAVAAFYKEYANGDHDKELNAANYDKIVDREGKRSFKECHELFGDRVVYTNAISGERFKLNELCPEFVDLRRAVESAQQAQRREKKRQTADKRRKK